MEIQTHTQHPQHPDRIVRIKEVAARVSVHRATLYEWMKAGTFPKAFKIGGSKAMGWRSSTIDAWIASREQQQ